MIQGALWSRWSLTYMLFGVVLIVGCAGGGGGGGGGESLVNFNDNGDQADHGDITAPEDKLALWTGGTELRGANIWQARNIPEVYGADTLGSGAVGPPFTQQDFDDLAATGANLVNISHPGLYPDKPPYQLEQAVQDNLDSLLEMIAQADLFAVITFRTGPGRSEFTFVAGEDTETDPDQGWFDPSYYNDSVWEDQEAQDAWADMWRDTAERYRDNPVVVGYDLMCEPNAEEVFFRIWGEPEEFYPAHANTTYDWNRFYPNLVAAIREVDPDTPILVQPMGYGSVVWLPYLELTDDTRTVYTVHQYEPSIYTYQAAPGQYSYPGQMDWYGLVDRAWLDNLLDTVDQFAADHDVPVAVNEFGVVRWVPQANVFMDDLMDLFEARGLNHALWEWSSSWEPFIWNDAFNFRHGPDPDNHSDVESAELMDVIGDYWGRNILRPSNAGDVADE